MNPINSFGALSSTGNINGNAAFGQKNSPDSAKMAAVIYKWASGNNEALTAPMNMDADIFPEPDDQDYENEGLSKTAALRNLYEKWAGVANTRRGPQNSLNAAALNI
jgi:hypothetical protein